LSWRFMSKWRNGSLWMSGLSGAGCFMGASVAEGRGARQFLSAHRD
jgi:hypothetical protein